MYPISGQVNILHFANRQESKQRIFFQCLSPHTAHDPAIIMQMSLPIQRFAKCADVFHRQKDLKGHTCSSYTIYMVWWKPGHFRRVYIKTVMQVQAHSHMTSLSGRTGLGR